MDPAVLTTVASLAVLVVLRGHETSFSAEVGTGVRRRAVA